MLVIAPTYSLPLRFKYLFTLPQRVAQKPIRYATIHFFKTSTAQLCSVTKIAPQSPFFHVNRSPTGIVFLPVKELCVDIVSGIQPPIFPEAYLKSLL